MKKIHFWIVGFVLLLSLTLSSAALAADPPQGSLPEGISQQVEVGDELTEPPVVEGGAIQGVATQYAFSLSSGTYTEILGGTVHGTASNDDDSFNAIPLGFTFHFNGVDYTEISIQSNGFVAMGANVSYSYYPLSTGTNNNVIAALGRDIEGNDTTSELMSLLEGSAPDRVFTIQWKHYKRYGASYIGDDLNFQIKLYETSGLVRFVYGPFTVLASATTTPVQVGLRGNSNLDFNNRTSATDWTATIAGLTNADTITLTDLIYPPSGLTYDWAFATGLFLEPQAQSGSACNRNSVTYQITINNQTGTAQSFNIAYSGVWASSGPASTGVIPNNSSEIIDVNVQVPWDAESGDYDILAIDVTSTSGGFSASATATTLASLATGYTDYSNVPAGREVRGASVVYAGGKLYKIGGYGYVSGTGASRPWLDIYDIAADTWSQGADMPGARYWIDCEEISGKIYCAGGYSTTGTNTLYIYDITLGTWSTAASTLPANRYNYASVKLNGKYYLIGGYTTTYSNSLLEYDPVSDTWNTSLPNMTSARRYAHAAVMGGKIYVAGGYNGTYLSSVEVYDPAVPGWSAGTPMPSPWVNAADGVLYDRFMILTGGHPSSTSGASNGALMYDALNDQWSWLPLYNRILYGAEGDGDGTQFWTVSGRMYLSGTWSNSPYTTLMDECPACYSFVDEDFENPFPPVNWNVINNGGTCVWMRNDQVTSGRPNYAGGDGFAADADSDRCGSGTTMDTELRTMTLDLTEVQTATLQYVTAYNDIATGGDIADVDVSIDGGSIWTNILHWDADHSPNGPGELVQLDLTPFAGNPNVLIRYHYYLATYDWWWEVDQVDVFGCVVPGAAPDIAVTPAELTQTLQANQTADQTFNIANNGLLPLSWTVDVGCGVPVSWLSAAPLAGTVPVYNDTDVIATFTSGSLAIDTYQAPICVNSDDPDSPTVEITATLIVTGTADIELDLPSLSVALPPDASSTLTGTVCNVGDGPLNWAISEVQSALLAGSQDVIPQAQQPAQPDIFRLPDGSVDCAAYQDYTGREPAEVAAACPVSVPQGLPGNPLAPTDIGYAQDIGYISDNFVSFTLNNFTGQTVVGTSTNAYYGMDFDPAAEVLYALNDTTDMLGTINLANGAFTPLVSCPPGGGAANWTGLSIDPVTGAFYASTATNLFTIDPATGVSTLVGPFGTTLMIDIAINMDQQMYGHDIGTDAIYSINMTTGAATLIGPTGYSANYAQGMDFDNEDGTLYIFLYIGSGANVYGTVNLSTGAVTPLAVSSPLGEFEGATMTAGLIDLPWLSEAPTGGTLLPGDCTDLDITYDSTGLPLDTYTGGLKISSNDPDEQEITLPVTLTVANLSMEFNKTVGIVPGVCASTASIAVPPGTEVVYCYSADNTSALTYSMLSIYDSELGQLFDHHLFILPPGENVYHLETVTILTDTTNTADFTLFFDETHAISATDSATVAVTKADLAVTKTGPAEVVAGDPITYTVSVENLGPNAATNVELVDTLPAGATFVAAPGCAYAAGAVTCNLASLPDGETATFEITISMAVAGKILNTVNVTADQFDLDLGNNHAEWQTAVAPSTSYIFLPIIFKN